MCHLYPYNNVKLLRKFFYIKNAIRHSKVPRAFSVAAPRAWNRLPTDLKLLHSTASFNSKLKSCFTFHAAYTGNTVWTLECAISLTVGGALQVTVVTVAVTNWTEYNLVIEKHGTSRLKLIFVDERQDADVVLAADGRRHDGVIVVDDLLQCSDRHRRPSQVIHLRPLLLKWTRGQSNLTKSASRGAHSPVRGHPRGSKFVPLNSWGRGSY